MEELGEAVGLESFDETKTQIPQKEGREIIRE